MVLQGPHWRLLPAQLATLWGASPDSSVGLCRASADPWATREPPGRRVHCAEAANEAGQSINDIPQSLLERLRAQAQHARRRDRIWIPLRRCERQTLRRSGSSRFSGRSRDPIQFARERIYAALPGRRADRRATGGTD